MFSAKTFQTFRLQNKFRSVYCNLKQAILEKNYGKTISGMALVCLHPNKNNYQLIPVLNLQTEVQALFNLRKNMLLMT